MRHIVSLKQNREFRRLYAKGRQAVSPCQVVYCRKNGRDCNRLGITVSTKLGGAVVRNRVRRRFREIYRLNLNRLCTGYDLVIVARSRAVGADYALLEADFLRLCGKLGLLAGGSI